MTRQEKEKNKANAEKFRKAVFKRYHFIKPKPIESESLLTDTSKERRKVEVELYSALKSNDSPMECENSVAYFLISGDWI